MKKQLKQILKEAKKQGWQVSYTKNGHMCLKSPTGGQPIYTASTPSDHRGLKNLVAHMRRQGFKWQGR